ncbi:MAG TPA: ABC transporter ATP-binding protein [Acidimicrobiia bacterium]|nr:ABC transporter ATP-binding protein [Acidimicrobiia bacterium]
MLSVDALTVRYDDFVALDAVDLAVADGEIVSVLGPSGSGKSTLLRAVAGLVPEAHGRVAWDGVDLAGVPTHRREFGLMFQDHALFPHRDVLGNVEFGLRMHGVTRSAIKERARVALERVGLTGFEHRSVAELSGGEQQRVALARALAPEPRLLMLDEPLGALDRALRERLVGELRTLFTALGLSVLFVTHDHDEAFALAERVIVMHEGRVAQVGTPNEVWQHPADAFVARFLGWNVTDAFDDTTRAIRPDGLRLTGAHPTGDDAVTGTVTARSFHRDHYLVDVTLDAGIGHQAVDAPLRVAVPIDQHPPEVGDAVEVAAVPGAGVPVSS